MGLLELLQQGQTQLSAGSFPGDTPINDPQSGFVQSNSPDLTYEDETMGQPNNGSTVISDSSNTSLNITYDWVTDYPPLVSGEFNGAPSLYSSIYDSNDTYLDNVPIQNLSSPQSASLKNTGLDNTNLNALPTTTIPNSVSYPNNYPALVSGELNGAPTQYTTPYSSNNTYLDNVSDDVDNIEINILGQTGLDNINLSSAQTTITPNSITYPNNYPALVSGEFNGAPSINPSYETPYNNVNTYLSNVPIQNITSPQLNTLDQSGLDNNSESAETAITPNSISYPNNYPTIEGVNLGVFNGAPSQYESPYNADNTYLSNVPIESENSRQKDTVLSGETALDNTLQQSQLTTTPPNSITSPTIYPNIPQTNLGEFNGAPSQYQTIYNPNSTYLDQYNSIVNGANPQIDSLQRTGMDVENGEYDPTTIFPPNPDNITTYPAIVGINLGVTGSGAKPFYQTFTPSNTYWDKYQTNRSLFDRILA
jgi:hypothetical protein